MNKQVASVYAAAEMSAAMPGSCTWWASTGASEDRRNGTGLRKPSLGGGFGSGVVTDARRWNQTNVRCTTRRAQPGVRFIRPRPCIYPCINLWPYSPPASGLG